MRTTKRKPEKMTTAAYYIVGAIIRKIEDPKLRQTVADHFATEFNRRSASFSPFDWERITGGKVAPNSARVAG